MEQIGYKEAAELLGKHPVQLRQAVSNGVLTQVPTTGYRKSLIKEQVLLFHGKRLSLSSLSRDERKQWDLYRDMSTGKTDVVTGTAFEILSNPETQKELGMKLLEAALGGIQKASPKELRQELERMGHVLADIPDPNVMQQATLGLIQTRLASEDAGAYMGTVIRSFFEHLIERLKSSAKEPIEQEHNRVKKTPVQTL